MSKHKKMAKTQKMAKNFKNIKNIKNVKNIKNIKNVKTSIQNNIKQPTTTQEQYCVQGSNNTRNNSSLLGPSLTATINQVRKTSAVPCPDNGLEHKQIRWDKNRALGLAKRTKMLICMLTKSFSGFTCLQKYTCKELGFQINYLDLNIGLEDSLNRPLQ